MCDKCNNINPCACNEPTFCGCSTKLDLLCTYYSGETLEPMGITEGMDGTQVISKINEYVKNILQNLDISPTVIESVGNGVAVYKGLSAGIIDEFKSLVGDIGIDITPEEDMVRFSINQDWLESIIIQTIDNNVLLPKLEFRWSELEAPGSPETNPNAWREYSTPDSKWMAVQSLPGITDPTNSPTTSTWDVVKVKGEDGIQGPIGPAGADGATGTDGSVGASSITSTVFKRASTKPERPVGGDYFNILPSGGWSDGIPEEDGNPVWMSMRLFTSNGGAPQEPEWSDPCLTVDTASIDFEFSNYTGPDPGTPDNPLGGAIWDNNATSDDIWMAMAQISNGVRGPWRIFKIKGEKGNNSVTINVFKRSTAQPITPTGGTYDTPVPDGWSNGIPSETDGGKPVWMSTRIFSSDGLYPQQNAWAIPTLIVDTATIDYEFSDFTGQFPGDPTTPLNGAVWSNNGNENTIWMAIAKISNGVRGQWVVTKIKGEQGDSGSSFSIISDNPVQSVAVGPNGILDVPREYSVTLDVYKDSTKLNATNNTTLNVGEYNINIPTSPLQGLTISKPQPNTLLFSLAPGTAIGDPINVPISVTATNEYIELKSTFNIVPIKSADDVVGLTLVSSTTSVRAGYTGNIVDPLQVSFNAIQQNYNETIHWSTVPLVTGLHGQEGFSKTIPSQDLFQTSDSVKVKISTENGMFDEVTVVKVKDGTPGEDGVGFTVMSSNPVESLAVGSDSTTSSIRTFEVPVHVYKGMAQLIPTNSTTLAYDNYKIVVPPSPFPGVTVAIHPSSAAILIYTVAAGTVFGEESVNSEIEVLIGENQTSAKTSFTIVPIKTAEDALSLKLHTDSAVGKYDAWGNLVAPTTISLRTVLQNYNDPIHWETSPQISGIHGQTTTGGQVLSIPTGAFFPGNTQAAVVTASTANGLYDTITIVKTLDGTHGNNGQAGAPGPIGTTGPSPRLLEFVEGGNYENGGEYIDYAYYRTSDVALEGWYTVKIVDGVRTVVQYPGGVPDMSKFNKAPFTKEMSFGTVIAEQANLAGFIFRNQVLYSQTGSNNASCHPFPGEFNANLSLNGLQGVIKFLDRMVMDTSGIVLKDNCGKPRMLFQWLEPDGIPILRFLNADGSIKWEAGQEGYKEIIIYTTPESWSNGWGAKKMTVETTPTQTDVPKTWACVDSDMYTVILGDNLHENSPLNNNGSFKTLYTYTAPTPASTATAMQLADNGKVFTGKSRTHYGYAQGWYLTTVSIVTPLEYPELNRESIEGTFTRYVDGVGVETIKRLVTTFIKPCEKT